MDSDQRGTPSEWATTEEAEDVAQDTVLAFAAAYRQGQSPDAVADELGMTRNSVYIAKHRVLKRLRELKARFEAEESGGAAANE